MEFFRNKLFVVLAVIAVITAFYFWWFGQPMEQIARTELMASIDQRYSQQFCKVIFPQIADCVTITADKCPEVASEQLAPCLEEMQYQIPEFATKAEAKQVYDSLQKCFQINMHDELLNNYAIDTPECQKRLS